MTNKPTAKFLEEATTPVARAIGNTLSSLWTITLGRIDIYAEKTQLKRAHALNQFKEELEQSISDIPEKNIVEPPLHIVGPSLEAAKYYFENDELRIMFAKLISAAMNANTINQTHPSFVEIIKQLSPLDATHLKLFKVQTRYPIVKYDYVTHDGFGNNTFKNNVFQEKKGHQDLNLNAASISNLNRLGLVSISYTYTLNNDDFYKKYVDSPFYKMAKAQIKKVNSDSTSPFPYVDIEIAKGTVEITPLGQSFIELCIQ